MPKTKNQNPKLTPQRGGEIPQDLYKLAIPFGMLFAQQGIHSILEGYKNKNKKKEAKSKSQDVKKSVQKNKKAGKKTQSGGCGCSNTPYQAVGGALTQACSTYLKKH